MIADLTTALLASSLKRMLGASVRESVSHEDAILFRNAANATGKQVSSTLLLTRRTKVLTDVSS